MKILPRLVALVCTLAIVFNTTACSQNTIAQLAQVLGNAGANIAQLEGNSDLSLKLQTDTTAAVSAITNWKTGTPAQEAIEALNLVADDLSLIPGTSKYQPLIVLAVGTVESILALLPQPATQSRVVVKSRVQLTNPPKNAGDFKKQWDAIAASNHLDNAKI